MLSLLFTNLTSKKSVPMINIKVPELNWISITSLNLLLTFKTNRGNAIIYFTIIKIVFNEVIG